jgi:type VI secretion system secreted protein VgrG
MPVTQANREVSVITALDTDVLLFRSMRGSEQLGRLSEYRVQLLSTDGALKIADVLGKPISVVLELSAGDLRHFHGIVTRFSSTGTSEGFASYEATVHPWLWLLTRAANCRIFQDKSAPAIVKEVCDAYGGVVALSAGSLSGTYPALPYCVQYRETDFNFVCRLLEAAGIYFFFTHDEDKHTMVLADSYGAHAQISGYGGLKFADDGQRGAPREESVSSWSTGGEIQSSNYVLNDFDFEKAAASVSGALVATANIAAGFAQAAYEMFDYPGNYTLSADGNALARARIESLHGQCEQVHAATNARGLFPGGMFVLADHPRDDQNREYLITSLAYDISGNDYLSGDSGGLNVQCSVTATGKEFAYRPLPVTAKPVVHGPQTAMVVGKAGEEIWTDKYGRVKVQFHWDRLGKEDENSSCWLRVAQGWAGKGWGAMSVPRIGMEVIVSFLDGDPDRPLVTGCVYNSDAMPPYPLPDEQTKSTIKSNSSKGGEGFNELRFEDKKGAEEVFVHAERDFNRVVKNNDSLKVGFETADKGDQAIGIKNDQTLEVGNDQTITVTHDQAVAIDGKQAVKVGTTIVIEAGTSIELKVGGSSIKIEAAKITIKSPEIEVAADANMKVKAGAMMDVNSGGIMTIGGALVKIN